MKEAEKVEKQLIPGQAMGFTPEELEAETQRIVKEKLEIIKQLNAIKYPLNATVFGQNQSWTIRNKAFWVAMSDKDEKVIEFMEKYLSSEK